MAEFLIRVLIIVLSVSNPFYETNSSKNVMYMEPQGVFEYSAYSNIDDITISVGFDTSLVSELYLSQSPIDYRVVSSKGETVCEKYETDTVLLCAYKLLRISEGKTYDIELQDIKPLSEGEYRVYVTFTAYSDKNMTEKYTCFTDFSLHISGQEADTVVVEKMLCDELLFIGYMNPGTEEEEDICGCYIKNVTDKKVSVNGWYGAKPLMSEEAYEWYDVPFDGVLQPGERAYFGYYQYQKVPTETDYDGMEYLWNMEVNRKPVKMSIIVGQ